MHYLVDSIMCASKELQSTLKVKDQFSCGTIGFFPSSFFFLDDFKIKGVYSFLIITEDLNISLSNGKLVND